LQPFLGLGSFRAARVRILLKRISRHIIKIAGPIIFAVGVEFPSLVARKAIQRITRIPPIPDEYPVP